MRSRDDSIAIGETAPASGDDPRPSAGGVGTSTTSPDSFQEREELGRGAMGVVHRVQRINGYLGYTDFAVKTPLPALIAHAGGLEAFRREAELALGLEPHPNVAACHFVRLESGVPRIYFEFIDGGSLEAWLESGKLQGNPDRAMELVLSIARGLEHAHAAGLIHQDVKPANVVMTSEGTAKVTDFGLASAGRVMIDSQAAWDAARSRTTNSIFASCGGGTPAFWSPEQAVLLGHVSAERPPHGRLTRASDVWSWAVTTLAVFGMPIGYGHQAHQAFRAWTAKVDLPSGLEYVLRCCLDEDPSRRPPMRTVVTELAALLGGGKTGEPPTPSASALNNRAVSWMELGRIDDAVRLLDRALVTDTRHARALFNLTLLRLRGGETTHESAVRAIEAAGASETERVVALACVDAEAGYRAQAQQRLEDRRGARRREASPYMSGDMIANLGDAYGLAAMGASAGSDDDWIEALERGISARAGGPFLAPFMWS